MAWYDTGTVSVTNGSTTVTGSGTNFVSGARIGEGFAGPDGRLYEIESITSATVLVLADAYLGSTQSGQDYKIVPTQSLTADLANQVTTLITDYQSVVDNAGEGKFDDGSAGSPAITFVQDQDTGFFRDTANEIAISVGGTKVGEFNSGGLDVTGLSVDTNTLHVDSTNNRVGIGTSSPDNLLTIQTGTYANAYVPVSNIRYNTNDVLKFGFTGAGGSIRTGTIDTGNYGFAVNTGDGTERMRIDSSGTLIHKAAAVFNEDGGDADFRVESDSNDHALFVDAGNAGRIHFGGTSSSAYAQTSGLGQLAYHIDNGSDFGSLVISNNADNGWSMLYLNKFAYTSGDDQRFINWYVNGVGLCNVQVNSAGTAIEYQTTSDRRLKKNIQDLTAGIETVKQLRPRSFEWITNEEKTFLAHGFIADEADGIIPEAVTGKANAVDEDGKPVYQSMEYSKLVPVLTAALQEAITKIETLEARIAALENA